MFTIKHDDRLKHGSSGMTLAQDIAQDIMSGALLPGDRLGEVALAARFQTSRGPVRDALRHLSSVGLVTFTPNIGASVRRMTSADARALYEIRMALETEAARLAAAHHTPQGADALRALLDRDAEAVTRHPAGAYLHPGSDHDFHSLIAALSGNELIHRALSEELYPQLVLLRRQHSNIQGRGQIALREHQRIAEAIVEGDSELAALLMRRHLSASWQAFASQLGPAGTEPQA